MIRWAAHRPAVVWATCASLLLAGGVSFTRLALATRTAVELPRLRISASWSGASAELVEMYVTAPIESAVQGVRGVRRTSSESREGGASLTTELERDADVQIARLAILERLELLRPEFPPGTTNLSVSNYVPEELSEQPLLRYTIAGPYTAGTIQRVTEELVNPRVSAVPGVAGVTQVGGTELGVAVTYDARRLRQLGISPAALGQALAEARAVQALGEERLGASRREVVLRDQPKVVQDLEGLPVRGAGGRVFRLGELASVRPEEDARGFFYRIDGQPAVAMSIARLPGADAIKTAAAVRRALGEVQSTLPPGIRFNVESDESVELARQLKDLVLRGAAAFVAVMLVLAVALRHARAVALVMGSAAVSVAGTALGLYLLDIPANLLTLAGLGMGIGILVQNGLVVVERLRFAPNTPDGRAEAGRRIAPAVVGATLTTAVVLLPFLYLQGNARAAFVPFAAAFVLALAWSVVAALVMVPALGAGHDLRASTHPRARRLYARFVAGTLRRRWLTLTLAVVTLGVLAWGFQTKVPRNVWGGWGRGVQRTTLAASVGFPRGSDPEALDRIMTELESMVLDRGDGVERVITQSRGGTDAVMVVRFTRESEYSGLPQALEDELTGRASMMGGASISVRGQGPGFSSGLGSVSTSNMRVKVLGYSYSGVERFADDVKRRLERIPRVRDVEISSGAWYGGERAYVVTLEPDRAALARFGVTAEELTRSVAREVRGQVGRQLIEIGGEEVPVTLKEVGARDRSLDELRDALVPNVAASPVRIGDLALVGEREALSQVIREDQQYVRMVSFDFKGPQKLARRTFDAFMRSVDVPPGYTIADPGFGPGIDDDSERGLWLVFAIGVVLVVLAVAVVFDSVWAAWMVFLSLPMALAGVAAAFWLTRTSFTREAAVGVILVVGLAVNQAILLVDAALERRRSNRAAGAAKALGARQALAAAVDRSAMTVLVTLTTLASLLPLAVGTDATGLFGAIALATTGGTIASTIGVMAVMPAVLVGRRGARRRAGKAKEPATATA